jgi:DNA-binding NtrC family response regulator
VVAASYGDLGSAVAAGEFREDLFYRLNVFAVQLPPLRERREDIVALADRFLILRGVPPDKISPAARERLTAHGWPGNVRELENALERALILAGEGKIGPEHVLSPAIVRGRSRAADVLTDGFDLDAFERELIYAALERAGGNKAAAARMLGITRRRLYSRLEALAAKEEKEE